VGYKHIIVWEGLDYIIFTCLGLIIIIALEESDILIILVGSDHINYKNCV
jgi:hypothetical protein